MKPLLKRLLSLLIVVGATGTAVYVVLMPQMQNQLGMGAGKRGKMAGDLPVPVAVGNAQLSDVPVYLNGVGTARARNTVTVRPQVDGRIMSIKFREGQDVKKGDVLALIDPATYQAALDQAIAKKALDEAQLGNAQRDLERYSRLSNLSVAEKTLDTQKALVAQLTAQLKQDDAAIASARTTLEYTTIVSPIDGRTGIRLVDEGNIVRGADASSAIVTITEVRPIAAIFTLPQQQLGQVNAAAAAGPVKVDVLDADGRTVLDTGMLQVVDNQVDQSTGTVRMKAEFPNADLKLWPGQFVNVRVLIDTLKQVVVIPTPAVQRGPNGTFTYVVSEDKASLRLITVGLQTENLAVITKGVSPQDIVVTSGFARLKDGARVILPGQPADRPAGPGKKGPSVSTTDPAGQGKSDGQSNFRTACGGDLAKLCPNVERNREAIRACLQSHKDALSPACRNVLSDSGTRKSREADAGRNDGTATP